MQKKDAYLVLDIGTGNVRVVVVNPHGDILGVATGDIVYHRDDLYPDSIYFDPEQLWLQLTQLGKRALEQAGTVLIKAVTTTSQREGIVLISKNEKSLIGLPNIDHRGREWEHTITDKNRVYKLTGRYPTSLFSAFKLTGIRERRSDIWDEFSFFLSISDWAEYIFTGIPKYEHSQASETLLYDVAKKEWSRELQNLFGLEENYFPPLADAATISGMVKKEVAHEWGIAETAVVVTGGGDTQLAIKSTQPSMDDVVIVSGTTTPIVKLVDTYITDPGERTWTSRDIENGRFVFEANAGVTGLNYQRLKEVFYPNEDYQTIENELKENKQSVCMASLGSLIASERQSINTGGFIFPVPVSHELTRSCFVRATLLDIAFSIAENYKLLSEIAGHQADYVWACGGGLKSKFLRQLIASVIHKKVQVRHGFQQSSAVGGALICNDALNIDNQLANIEVEVAHPAEQDMYTALYKEWKKTRNFFSQTR